MKDVSKDKKIAEKSIDILPEENNKSTDDLKIEELKDMNEETAQMIISLRQGLKKSKDDKVIIGKNDQSQVGGGGGGGIMTLPVNLKESKDNKPLRKDAVLRKKLHELERSPPRKLDIKNIKSKVECWGQDANTKKIKKSVDISTNLDISEDKKSSNDFLSDLYSIYNNIENHFSNLDTFFNQKSEAMTTFKIPIINSNSFYVQHFSNEIYEELKGHINKHYQEIKN